MPTEIENHIHRIGRTGTTGVATAFINKDVPESALLDLKHLLMESSGIHRQVRSLGKFARAKASQ